MKYVGTKQVLKAVQEGDTVNVYIGKDAEKHVVAELINLCSEKKIEIKYIDTMEELGKLAGVEVKTAAAAE